MGNDYEQTFGEQGNINGQSTWKMLYQFVFREGKQKTLKVFLTGRDLLQEIKCLRTYWNSWRKKTGKATLALRFITRLQKTRKLLLSPRPGTMVTYAPGNHSCHRQRWEICTLVKAPAFAYHWQKKTSAWQNFK